jgi:hypothetical protein
MGIFGELGGNTLRTSKSKKTQNLFKIKFEMIPKNKPKLAPT